MYVKTLSLVYGPSLAHCHCRIRFWTALEHTDRGFEYLLEHILVCVWAHYVVLFLFNSRYFLFLLSVYYHVFMAR
jgi:hypothetical protein